MCVYLFYFFCFFNASAIPLSAAPSSGGGEHIPFLITKAVSPSGGGDTRCCWLNGVPNFKASRVRVARAGESCRRFRTTVAGQLGLKLASTQKNQPQQAKESRQLSPTQRDSTLSCWSVRSRAPAFVEFRKVCASMVPRHVWIFFGVHLNTSSDVANGVWLVVRFFPLSRTPLSSPCHTRRSVFQNNEPFQNLYRLNAARNFFWHTFNKRNSGQIFITKFCIENEEHKKKWTSTESGTFNHF